MLLIAARAEAQFGRNVVPAEDYRVELGAVFFWDFDLYGTVNIGRHLGVQGGYRSIDAEYLVDQDVGQLNLKGPYLGGVVRF